MEMASELLYKSFVSRAGDFDSSCSHRAFYKGKEMRGVPNTRRRFCRRDYGDAAGGAGR